MKRFGYGNLMQAPKLSKVVLNVSLGEAITNAKALEAAEADLAAIAGQHVLTTRSKNLSKASTTRGGPGIPFVK